MEGRFAGQHGQFYGHEEIEGGSIHVRFDWYARTEASARWEQAFSFDDGTTWQTNWVWELTRDAAA